MTGGISQLIRNSAAEYLISTAHVCEQVTRRLMETIMNLGLANDLRTAFPMMKGFSPRNLKYMRAFADAWPGGAIVQQAVGQLPWGHNLVLLTKLKDPERRLAYAERAKAAAREIAELANPGAELSSVAKWCVWLHHDPQLTRLV